MKFGPRGVEIWDLKSSLIVSRFISRTNLGVPHVKIYLGLKGRAWAQNIVQIDISQLFNIGHHDDARAQKMSVY